MNETEQERISDSATKRREPWQTPYVITSSVSETEKFPNIFEGDPGDNNGFNS